MLVLGMHRSGTSALTGTLARLGVAIGDDLLGPNASVNERGFYELRPIVAQHDALLSAFDSSWQDLEPLPSNWHRTPVVTSIRKRLAETLCAQFAGEALWAIKDPRLCRLLPMWIELLEEMQVEPVVVIVHRAPLEVAASLRRRDAMHEERALALWAEHVLSAERGTRGAKRSFVAYAKLLEDWRACVSQLGEELGIVWPVTFATARVSDRRLSRRYVASPSFDPREAGRSCVSLA